MRKTLRNVGLVMLLSVGVVSLAMAQGQGGNAAPAAGKGVRKGPVSDLTPDQQTKIATLRAAAMEKAAPLRGELKAKMVEMRQLWATEKPDRKAITGKQAEMDAIHQKMRAIWTDFGLEVHALLTPAQRAEWAQNPGHGWGMGMGMGKGKGMMGAGGPRGRHGGGPGHGPGRGMGPGMEQGMEGCPCGSPMCPMGQP